MNPTRMLFRSAAAIAASTLVAGLGVATTTTTSQASAPGASHQRGGNAFTVTLTSSKADPEQGTTIKLKGQVKPARPGSEVLLQKKYAGDKKWKDADTDTLNKAGKFKFKDEVDTVRFRQYRVIKAAEGGRASGQSPNVDVTVYGWRYLTSIGAVSATNTWSTGSATINAKPYSSSIVGSAYTNSGSIAYNLQRKCKRFEGRVGLEDSSEITATGTVKLKADTTEFYSNSFQLTQSAPVGRDVTGVFRLTVDWSSANTEGTPTDQSGAVIAVGSPRLLCSF